MLQHSSNGSCETATAEITKIWKLTDGNRKSEIRGSPAFFLAIFLPKPSISCSLSARKSTGNTPAQYTSFQPAQPVIH